MAGKRSKVEGEILSPEATTIIGEAVKQAEKLINERVQNINFLMGAVVIVIFIAFIAMILELFRFSSTTCQEYSSKIETQNVLLKTNKELLETVRQNQEAIKQINEVLKKSGK